MANRMHDYVPRNDAHYHNWFKNIVDYVKAKTKKPGADWNFILDETLFELYDAYDDWEKHYEPTLAAHTPVVTTEKNVARRRSEAVVRAFVQRFLHWPPVTEGDRRGFIRCCLRGLGFAIGFCLGASPP